MISLSTKEKRRVGPNIRNRRSGYGIGVSKALTQWCKKKGIRLP